MSLRNWVPLSIGSTVATRNNVWLLGVTFIQILQLAPFYTYVAALPLIQEEWGLSNTAAGLVQAAYLVGYALGSLVVIPLTDRIPAKNVIIASALLGGVSELLFALLADGLALGAVLHFLSGVGQIGVYMGGNRIVAERFAEGRRGGAIGLFVAGNYLGYNISLLVSGILIPPLGWRYAYVVLSLVSLSSPLLAYALLKGQPLVQPLKSSGILNLKVLRNRPVALLILSYACHSWELFLMQAWLPAFLAAMLFSRDRAQTEAVATAAIVVGIFGIVGSVSPFLGGLLSDRFGRARTAATIFILSGAGSLALGWMGGLVGPLILLVALIYILSAGADSAIYTAGVTEAARPGQVGSTLALHSFIGFGVGSIAPIAFGAIRDATNSSLGWGLGFSTGGIAAFIAIAGLLWLRRLPQNRLLANGRD